LLLATNLTGTSRARVSLKFMLQYGLWEDSGDLDDCC